jgi:hypothetical protein
MGVTLTTPFTWSDDSGGVYLFVAMGGSDYRFVGITAGMPATIPDLTSFGLPLATSTDFSWEVEAFAPLVSVDALAAQSMSQFLAGSYTGGLSALRSFTTAP